MGGEEGVGVQVARPNGQEGPGVLSRSGEEGVSEPFGAGGAGAEFVFQDAGG